MGNSVLEVCINFPSYDKERFQGLTLAFPLLAKFADAPSEKKTIELLTNKKKQARAILLCSMEITVKAWY